MCALNVYRIPPAAYLHRRHFGTCQTNSTSHFQSYHPALTSPLNLPSHRSNRVSSSLCIVLLGIPSGKTLPRNMPSSSHPGDADTQRPWDNNVAMPISRQKHLSAARIPPARPGPHTASPSPDLPDVPGRHQNADPSGCASPPDSGAVPTSLCVRVCRRPLSGRRLHTSGDASSFQILDNQLSELVSWMHDLSE